MVLCCEDCRLQTLSLLGIHTKIEVMKFQQCRQHIEGKVFLGYCVTVVERKKCQTIGDVMNSQLQRSNVVRHDE